MSFVPVYTQATLHILENVKETSESRLGYGNNCTLGKWESRLVIALIYVVNNFIEPLSEKELIEQVGCFIRSKGNTGFSFACIVICSLQCRLHFSVTWALDVWWPFETKLLLSISVEYSSMYCLELQLSSSMEKTKMCNTWHCVPSNRVWAEDPQISKHGLVWHSLS